MAALTPTPDTADPYAPTAYSAALLQAVRQLAAAQAPQSALEIGTGSGVVLAALLAAGCARAVGVELEPDAVARTRELLAAAGWADRAEVRAGSLWAPVSGERFDLIACNPPQFPVLQPLDDGRRPSWSSGGPDGRSFITPFIEELAGHLAPQGVALLTHNAFIGLPATQAQLAAQGLQAQVLSTVCVPLPRHKLDGLNPAVLQQHLGRGLYREGPYAFADFQVLAIRHLTQAAADV